MKKHAKKTEDTMATNVRIPFYQHSHKTFHDSVIAINCKISLGVFRGITCQLGCQGNRHVSNGTNV